MMSEVSAAMNTQSLIFWAMTPSSFVGCCQCFKGKYCLLIEECRI
jgi:hypothetical protein